MRTNIEIDDTLMAEAMELAGVSTKRAAVEAGLRALVNAAERQDSQRIFRTLHGAGWTGEREEMPHA
jgi:Arc/MetJ family transcription regulator